MFFFKIFGKFIGILLIIAGASTIIGLFIGLLTVGTLDWVHMPGLDNFILNSTEAPVWLISIALFFAIAIPFFFLLYLGLKILVTNLKSIGNIAKFSLLGLWIISVIGIIIIGVREAAQHAYSGTTTVENELFIENPTDTLNISLVSSKYRENRGRVRMDQVIMTYNEDGEEIMLSEDFRLVIKKSNDSIIRLDIRKEANGSSFSKARENADLIDYSYQVIGNNIILDDYSVIPEGNKFNNLEVKATLYIPKNMIIKYDQTNNRCYRIRAKYNRDLRDCEVQDHTWRMANNGELQCLDCAAFDAKYEDDNEKVIINGEGIDININENGENNKIKINQEGIDIDIKDNGNGESFKMKINEDGVKIDANDN